MLTTGQFALDARKAVPDHFVGRNGPGGWLFFDEPELHFGNDVLVPDIAAWRRTRLPASMPEPYLTLKLRWVHS